MATIEFNQRLNTLRAVVPPPAAKADWERALANCDTVSDLADLESWARAWRAEAKWQTHMVGGAA